MANLSLCLTCFVSLRKSIQNNRLTAIPLVNLQIVTAFRTMLLPLITLFAATPVTGAEFSIEAEIAAASEAAPANVTAAATYLAFEQDHFQILRTGTNNFTCLVIRDPQGRFEPACLNEEAMRSVFPTYALEMKLLYAGTAPSDIKRHLSEAYSAGQIPAAEPGALVYMMSQNNLNYNADSEILAPTPVHQMYYFPKISDETFSLTGNLPVRLWQGFPHLSALIVDVTD